MIVPVCICCGQPIPEQRSSQSGNPNVCAACAELAEATEIQLHQPTEPTPAKKEIPKQPRRMRKAA